MTVFNNEIAVMLQAAKLQMPEILFSSEFQHDAFQSHIAEILNAHARILCVSDAASNKAGKHILADVANMKGEIFHQIFEAPISASMENALRIIYAIAELNISAVVALGSGSVNDVCKYAAHHAKLPYICLPTAASMNGYTAENASLLYKGLKQSFPATLATHIIIDEKVITDAPEHMTQAGFADAFAATSAMLDWKLSHYAIDTIFRDFTTLAHFNPADVAEKSTAIKTLLVQGFAMSIAGSSAPASGGEHMLAHVVELMHPELTAGLLHGELIAHCLLVYALHQNNVAKSDKAPTLKPWKDEAELAAVFGDKWPSIQPLYAKKYAILEKNADKITERLKHYWHKWQPEFSSQLLSTQHMERLKPIASNKKLLEACEHYMPLVHHTRDRFTFLDITS